MESVPLISKIIGGGITLILLAWFIAGIDMLNPLLNEYLFRIQL